MIPTPTPTPVIQTVEGAVTAASGVVTPILTLLNGIVSTTPFGAGVLAGLIVGGVILYAVIVRRINAMIDTSDLHNAESDAGQTSVDMANQSDRARQDLDQMEKFNPPKGAP